MLVQQRPRGRQVHHHVHVTWHNQRPSTWCAPCVLRGRGQLLDQGKWQLTITRKNTWGHRTTQADKHHLVYWAPSLRLEAWALGLAQSQSCVRSTGGHAA